MGRIIIQHVDPALSSALEDEGYSVLSVLCPESILAGIACFNPHVVVLNFDSEDSLATCRAIKSEFPNTAVIAMSNNHLIADHHSEYGFNGYIARPITINRLLPVVELFSIKSLAEAS
jgi:DNA-binding response OmpR family regulator